MNTIIFFIIYAIIPVCYVMRVSRGNEGKQRLLHSKQWGVSVLVPFLGSLTVVLPSLGCSSRYPHVQYTAMVITLSYSFFTRSEYTVL